MSATKISKEELEKLVAMAPRTLACVKALNDGDLASAKLQMLDFLESPLARHKALIARVLLAADEHLMADRMLRIAEQRVSAKSSKSHQYIAEFCRAFLCLPHDTEGFRRHAQAAIALEPDASLFSTLPIFDPDEHPQILAGLIRLN
jgi:hypothetical protein